jgi:hypothetical protein
MHRHENCHAQPADTVQDKRQHRTLAFVPQSRGQADISFQAHLRLLTNFVGKMAYYPIQVAFIKSDNTHGLFVSDFL